mgnify:CR=1 FL=1
MSVTHIPGCVIEIKGRIIQRCMLCGEKLCDNKNVMMPVGPDGEDPIFPTFKIGSLIECEGNRMFMVEEDFTKKDVRLPDDLCLSLIE